MVANERVSIWERVQLANKCANKSALTVRRLPDRRELPGEADGAGAQAANILEESLNFKIS